VVVICGKSRKSRRISVYPCVLEHVRQHETGSSVIMKLEQLPETRTTFMISHKQGRVHDKKRTGLIVQKTMKNQFTVQQLSVIGIDIAKTTQTIRRRKAARPL
jgi:hypothetical protein